MARRSKYGLFDGSDVENRAQHLLSEGKTALEVQAILKEEGYGDIPPVDEIRHIKKLIHERTRTEGKEEILADYLLDSMDKIKEKFETEYERLEKLAEYYESEGKHFELLSAERELIQMFKLALKKFADERRQIMNIRANQINITNTDVMIAIKQNIVKIFDNMDPELKNGKLIFNSPSPEFIDEYYKWKSRKKNKEKALANAKSS